MGDVKYFATFTVFRFDSTFRDILEATFFAPSLQVWEQKMSRNTFPSKVFPT